MRIFLTLLFVSPLAFPFAAHAVQAGGLGAYPTGQAASPTPWFQYRLAAGQTATGSLTVDNLSSATRDLILYPVDAAPNGDGGFGMAPQYPGPSDAGGWVHLATSQLQLAPHSTQTVSFSFAVPAHPSVGPHYAGIIVQPWAPAPAAASPLNLQVISRLGVRLYATVPGAQHPNLTITNLQRLRRTHPLALSATIRNLGNTILTPSGQLDLTDEFGRRVAAASLSLGRSLPPVAAATATLHLPTHAAWLPGRYHARLQIAYGSGAQAKVAYRTISFWAGNPAIILIIAIITLIIILILRWLSLV